MPTAADFPYFHTPPMALAHRGGSFYPPNVGLENSATAFAHAVELGFRYLETDVHATADGVLVAFHDEHLDRVSDIRGAIASLPWSVVRQARIGGREPIPTLAQLLESFPGARFNIDIKAPGAIEPLWRLICDMGAEDRVCIGSFSDRRLARFRRLSGGRVATSAGPTDVAATRLLPRRLTALLRSPAVALQIPVSQPLPRSSRELTVVTPGLLRRAHQAGKQVHVWTIDDADEMRRLLDLGVDGIVTDRPDILKDVLVSRNQWQA